MPQDTPVQPDFPTLRRGGFDPAAVEAHLTEIRRYFEKKIAAEQARANSIQIELDEARKREEAVHLTLVAATKTKEELLTNAEQQAEAMVSRSREQADSLLAEAKKEAFRLVSEARESAESAATSARDEATRLRADAEESAEATRNAARREAIEMITTVESDTAALVAAQEAAVNDMRRRYEEEEAELAARVEVLRGTAADLEARLKAIATGSLGQAGTLVAETQAESPQPAPVTAPEPPAVAPKARRPVRHDLTSTTVAAQSAQEEEPAPEVQPEPVAAAAEEVEEVSSVVEPVAEGAEIEQVEAPAEPVEEPAPAVAEVAEVEEMPEEEVAEEPVPASVGAARTNRYEDGDAAGDGHRKGSYYSRRSAKLPRIGTEAGRSALAAANAIRGATRGEPVDDQDTTAQTA